MKDSNAYLRTRVMSASPAELRLMLFDGAIRFLTQGVEGLEQNEHESAYDGYSKCQAIIIELLNALDPTHAPELCERLSALYTFMYTHLVESLSNQEPQKGREILELLEYERETWRQVMEKLAAEGMELKVPEANAQAPAIDPADTAAHVQGGGAAPVPVRRPAMGGYGRSGGAAPGGGGSLSVSG